METQAIDVLFLELSQVTKATTAKELMLLKRIAELEAALAKSVAAERQRCFKIVADSRVSAYDSAVGEVAALLVMDMQREILDEIKGEG